MQLRLENPTFKIVLLSLLGALGAVLMSFVRIPYPFAPFLMIEFSDVVVLLAFLLFGWKEAAFIGILKSLLNIMIWGPVGPVAIGQISAFLASMAYVSGLYFILKSRLTTKPLLMAPLIILWMSFLMIVVNYVLVTPVYLGTNFIEIQDSMAFAGFLEFLELDPGLGYLAFTFIIYGPFNLIKGAAVMFTYFVISRVTISYFELDLKESI